VIQTIRVPSKTFIFGEYSALVGEPALIVTTEPYFEIELEQRDKALSAQSLWLHEQSPAYLYLKQLSQSKIWDIKNLKCDYPVGGLGQSSAEFVAVFKANDGNLATIRDQFRALFDHDAGVMNRPSGYDVVAQCYEGYVGISPGEDEILVVNQWPFHGLSFLIVASGQKLKTHEHLNQESLSLKGETLSPLSRNAYQCWKQKDLRSFISSIKDFRHGLQSLGLESLHTSRLIERFEPLPGFLAAKGCGAMGHDFFILFFETQHKAKYVKKVREYSDLRLLCDETRVQVNDAI
jgi:mevalonate kinase